MTRAQELMVLQSRQLAEGISQLGISLSGQQCASLVDYLQLLNKWNKAFNLTAVRDPADHVSRHLLDCLALLPLLTEAELALAKDSSSALTTAPVFLDVGTGPGLPGIPLAIAMPHSHWYLVDSNGKKTRFLSQCKMELGLQNADVIQSRVESLRLPPDCRLAGITSRAFATLKLFVTATKDLVSASQTEPSNVRLYAMKGLYPKNEVSELPKNYKIHRVVKFSIPNSVGERHVLILGRQD